jgi:hypothetical protein
MMSLRAEELSPEMLRERDRRLMMAKENQVAADIFASIEERREKDRRKNEHDPELNDSNMKVDFRFIAGRISAFSEVLGLPYEAHERYTRGE